MFRFVLASSVRRSPPPKNLERQTHWYNDRENSAESCTGRKASNDKEHLVVVRLQSESIGEVAAMVIPRIERKPEGWGAGDEFEVVSDVVQN